MRRALHGFRFMLASRGWLRGLFRASLIARRFGLGRRGMERNLECLVEILERHGARATLFVPAAVFARHRKSLDRFRRPVIEWGIHSDDHTDLSRMTKEEQETRVHNAVSLFDQGDLAFSGFRAPYLKTNSATVEALSTAGRFSYDSSSCVLWDEVYLPSSAYFSWCLGFYQPTRHSHTPLGIDHGGELIRIPVSLPDDDILVDRERLAPAEVFAVWSAMLERSHQAGEIFVLQLHPERVRELAGVLSQLLELAARLSPPVWLPSLGEVAERVSSGAEGWPRPYRSAFCVTGDLDAMAISDFFVRLETW